MHQQLWGYKVEEKLNLGVREQKSLNTTCLEISLWKRPLGPSQGRLPDEDTDIRTNSDYFTVQH
jgi:hypothetical protein